MSLKYEPSSGPLHISANPKRWTLNTQELLNVLDNFERAEGAITTETDREASIKKSYDVGCRVWGAGGCRVQGAGCGV